MAGKRHKAEEIVTKLRQVDVLNAQVKSMAEAIRSIGVTEVTYYRWRSEYGGPEGRQADGSPFMEIALHRRTGRKVLERHPPLATCRGDIEKGVRNLAQSKPSCSPSNLRKSEGIKTD